MKSAKQMWLELQLLQSAGPMNNDSASVFSDSVRFDPSFTVPQKGYAKRGIQENITFR